MKLKILNYYEDRIPKDLQCLVKNKFKKKFLHLNLQPIKKKYLNKYNLFNGQMFFY